MPGVEAAGVIHALPFGGFSTGTFVTRLASSDQAQARWCLVRPDYFRTLRIPLIRGRAFEAGELRARQKRWEPGSGRSLVRW